MPTQRVVTLSNGKSFLGGINYSVSEDCEWFLDGSAEGQGFGPGELEPTDEMRAAWEAWIQVCREVWEERAPSPACGHRPDMPEGFPIDAMHESQGAGVGVDSDREWADGMTDDQIAHLAAPFERLTRWGTDYHALRSAFQAFEDATTNAIPEADDCDD